MKSHFNQLKILHISKQQVSLGTIIKMLNKPYTNAKVIKIRKVLLLIPHSKGISCLKNSKYQ